VSSSGPRSRRDGGRVGVGNADVAGEAGAALAAAEGRTGAWRLTKRSAHSTSSHQHSAQATHRMRDRLALHELVAAHRIESVSRAREGPRLFAKSPALPGGSGLAPEPPQLLLLRARQPVLPVALIQIRLLEPASGSVSGVIPRSSAIWRWDFPLIRASRMASARNSGAYG
jgi:hypothetical protein